MEISIKVRLRGKKRREQEKGGINMVKLKKGRCEQRLVLGKEAEHAAHLALACVSHRYILPSTGPVHCYQLE